MLHKKSDQHATRNSTACPLATSTAIRGIDVTGKRAWGVCRSRSCPRRHKGAAICLPSLSRVSLPCGPEACRIQMSIASDGECCHRRYSVNCSEPSHEGPHVLPMTCPPQPHDEVVLRVDRLRNLRDVSCKNPDLGLKKPNLYYTQHLRCIEFSMCTSQTPDTACPNHANSLSMLFFNFASRSSQGFHVQLARPHLI